MKFTSEQRRLKVRYAIRKKIKGTAQRPRMSVFKSNKEIYCQLIDDVAGVTLASASSLGKNYTGTKTERAKQVGLAIAEAAKASNIEVIVFDRSGYPYHGRVKQLAEGAREGGLNF